MAKVAHRQWLVDVAGIEGHFSIKTGGERQADVSEIWDGGSLIPDLLSGPPTTSNLSVTRPYDFPRDQAILATLRQQVGKFVTSVTITALDRDMNVIGTPTTYSECLLIKLGEPEINASQSEASTFDLEFKARSISN